MTRPGVEPCVIWFTGLSGAGKSTIIDTRSVPVDEAVSRLIRTITTVRVAAAVELL